MTTGERIKSARRRKGLSLRKLAELVGVSAQAISKYERNKDIPGSRVLIRLSDALNTNVEFLVRPTTVSFSPPNYRCYSSKLTHRDEEIVQAQVQDWLERYLTIEELLSETQSFVMPPINRKVDSLKEIERVAEELRIEWQLGLDPIPNLTETLEGHGVKVGFVQGVDEFDALSFTANKDYPIIVIKNDVPGDRQRFSIAHELGHLILELPQKWGKKETERAANHFAGAFLVPALTVREELGEHRQNLDLEELHILKHKYGLSMQAWIHRAQDLGIVSEAVAQNLYRQFRQNQWHLKEPGDPYPHECTTRMKRMIIRALRDDIIGEMRATELMAKSITEFSIEAKQHHDGAPIPICD